MFKKNLEKHVTLHDKVGLMTYTTSVVVAHLIHFSTEHRSFGFFRLDSPRVAVIDLENDIQLL
jgi:hypothetical protein